jgi:hypothetical protein
MDCNINGCINMLLIILIIIILFSMCNIRSKTTEHFYYKGGGCTQGYLEVDGPFGCCPSGDNELFGGYHYCTEMSNGSKCWSNDMCASGACLGGWGEKGECGSAQYKEYCDSVFEQQLNGECGQFIHNTSGSVANSAAGIACTEIVNAQLSTCYQTGKWP